MKYCRALMLLLLALRCAFPAVAAPLTRAAMAELADAICRGTVLQTTAFRGDDGGIYTSVAIRVDEALKGKFPQMVALVHRGGVLENEGERNGFAPALRVGDERLFFLSRRPDGTLFATEGGAGAIRLRRSNPALASTGNFDAAGEALLAEIRREYPAPGAAGLDVTDQATRVVTSSATKLASGGGGSVTGLLVDDNGIGQRFTAPDRGEAIPYFIDAQALPAGVSLAQATNAVIHAFNVWSNVTSLKFAFAGLTNFGQAAANINVRDGALRIQLHDLFGVVSGATTLGIGGAYYTTLSPSVFPAGGGGGRVGANEFNLTTQGYVVMKHTATALQTLATFEEVLTHEIGHALGMAHSSEDPDEADATLRGSIMYYTAHADGRGAQLGVYDPPVIQQAQPVNNTPPYAYDRVIYAVTSQSPLANPRVNQVEMTGYDRQDLVLTATLHAATTINGSFAFANGKVTYTPVGAFSDSDPIDPATTAFYDRVYVRFSDGVNLSPPALVRVVQLLLCLQPANAPDGLPDSWRAQYFPGGTPTDGSAGANNDPDHDGLTNLQEFIMGTNPTQPTQALAISNFNLTSLHWAARPYALYEVEGSTTLTNWTRLINPVISTTADGFTPLSLGSTNHLFMRIKLVP